MILSNDPGMESELDAFEVDLHKLYGVYRTICKAHALDKTLSNKQSRKTLAAQVRLR